MKKWEDSAEEELDLSSCTDNTVNYAHSNYLQPIITQTFPNQADSTLPVTIHSNGAKDLSVLNPNPEQQTCVALYNIKSLKVISTNFQSVVNKVPLLLEVINKHNPEGLNHG